MKIKKNEMKFPVLLAQPHADEDQLAVFCPFCIRFHYHGNTYGHKVAQCRNPYSPFLKTGYIIKKITKNERLGINITSFVEGEYENNASKVL